jgi:GNAT superfamily N-acetyltransferase
MVDEDFHGQGIASRLLRHLATVATMQGIRTFEADVLADNKAMLTVFARTGWPMTKTREGDVIHVKLALTAVS